MTAADLVIGKTYRIRRVQSAYFGRKRQVYWVVGKFIGIDRNWANFAINEDAETSIDVNDVDKIVREETGKRDKRIKYAEE